MTGVTATKTTGPMNRRNLRAHIMACLLRQLFMYYRYVTGVRINMKTIKNPEIHKAQIRPEDEL